MKTRSESGQSRIPFLLGGGLVVAHQVAGKAVRDGLFLSQFSPGDLPKVMVLAALVAVLLGIAFSRMLARYGPVRVMPGAFAVGALLHAVEFGLLQMAGEGARAAVTTVVYLHLVGFGSILLSGFWSMAGEVFDPRVAKREFGKIAGAGTAGGVCGGLLAARGAALFGAEALLVLLAALHLAAWLVLRHVEADEDAHAEAPDMRDAWDAAVAAFRRAPFLVNLAALVLLSTVSATLLDYLFKSGAAAEYGKGPRLTGYFALFYTAGQVLTFLVQSFLTPVALRRLGLGRTAQAHSTAVAAGAAASLFLPAAVMAPGVRALELVFRGSFFRSSYELFFTPAPPRDKRAIKTFIDVSCDRMGDIVGAGILQLLLLAGPSHAAKPILMVTATLAAICFWITRRMDSAYTRVLEQGLLNRAIVLNEAQVEDSTTLAALMSTSSMFPRNGASMLRAPEARAGAQDAVIARLEDLRSGITRRVQAALSPHQPFDTAVVPFAIRLLGWRESFEWSRAFLLRHAHQVVGQLTDSLLDPAEDFAVRRRIPHILAYTSSQRAVDGLTRALSDVRFEIRFNASRAIEFLHRMSDGLRFDSAAILAAAEREVCTPRTIWQSRRLLDNREPGNEANNSSVTYLDNVLRDEADKSLEHVFSLLAVLLPAEPLSVAFRALHSRDRMLRGLALEFLESHLTAEFVSQLRRLVDPGPAAAPPRQAPEVLRDLMASEPNTLLVPGETA